MLKNIFSSNPMKGILALATLPRVLSLAAVAGIVVGANSLESLLSPKGSVDAARLESARSYVASLMEVPHEENMYVVKFDDDVSAQEVNAINEEYDADVKAQDQPDWVTENGQIQIVEVADDEEMQEEMQKFYLDPDVEYVEISAIGEFSWVDSGAETYSDEFDQTPDPDSGKHWYYSKTGLPEVWDDQKCATGGGDCGGDSDVIVAVLDSGVAFENYNTGNYEAYGSNYNTNFAIASELNGINLWTNPGEDGTGHGDDDGNGICDDDHGVDFGIWYENQGDARDCAVSTDTQKEGHPNDDYGHGTFVTGIIASLTNNGASSVGSAHNVSIMPLKITYPFSQPSSAPFYYSVLYAVDNGADVISVSSGWTNSNSLLKDAVDYAEENGVLVVVSAGNGGGDTITYPAAYSNTFAIGATNKNDTISWYSDYGPELTMVAPVGPGGTEGKAAYQQSLTCFATSCGPASDFTSFSNQYSIGTSYASPQVSAAAALVRSRVPLASYREVKDYLTYTAKDIGPSGYDIYMGYGLLDLETLWNSIWTGIYGEAGTTREPISSVVVGDLLYQVRVHVSTRNVYLRTYDGVTWTSWNKIPPKSTDGPAVAYYKNRLRIFTTGLSNKRVYMWTRAGGTWTAQSTNLKTDQNLDVKAFSNRLHVTTVDPVTDKVYVTNYYQGTWSPSHYLGGRSKLGVRLVLYNGKIFAATVSGSSNYVYLWRSLNGATWSSLGNTWMRSRYEVPMAVYGGNIYLLYTGVNSSTVYAQKYALGEYSQTISLGRRSMLAPDAVQFDGRLYQFPVGFYNSRIYKRHKL